MGRDTSERTKHNDNKNTDRFPCFTPTTASGTSEGLPGYRPFPLIRVALKELWKSLQSAFHETSKTYESFVAFVER